MTETALNRLAWLTYVASPFVLYSMQKSHFPWLASVVTCVTSIILLLCLPHIIYPMGTDAVSLQRGESPIILGFVIAHTFQWTLKMLELCFQFKKFTNQQNIQNG